MPCKDCEENPKLRVAVICPDPWISGARDGQTSASRPKSENKLLTTKSRYSPYGGGLGLNQKCSICKRQLAAGGKFCTECAHHRGLCYICGKVVMDTSAYTHHENKLLDEKVSRKDIDAFRPTVRGGTGGAAAAPEPAPAPKKAPKPEKDDVDLAEQQAAAAGQRAAAKKAPGKKAAGKAAAGGAAAGGGGPQALRTVGEWTELDGGEGRVYYYNNATQETTWEVPADFAPEASVSQEGGGWAAVQTPEGHTYYYNGTSGETTWTPPEGFTAPTAT